MWKEFYRLNKKKLFFTHSVLWIAMCVLILVLLRLFGRNQPVTLETGIQIALIYSTAITAISLTVSLLTGFYKFSQKRVFFNQQNWEEFFEKNKFNTTLINENAKLSPTQEIKTGMVDIFFIEIDISKEDSRIIQVKFYVHSEPINKERFMFLEKKLKVHKAGLEIGYVFKNLNKHTIISEIESELTEFCDLLRSERFIPMDHNKAFQGLEVYDQRIS